MRGIFAAVAAVVILAGCASEPYDWKKDSRFAEIAREQDELSKRIRETTLASGWRVDCDIDKMTDKKKCFSHKRFDDQVVRVEKNEYGTWLTFSLNSHPGRLGRVRIDSHPAISYEKTIITDKSTVDTLISQMKTGKQGISQTTVWPGRPVELTFSLEGFGDAYARLEELYGQP